MKQWNVSNPGSFESLKLSTDLPVPQPSGRDVLVRFHAASLNFRNLMIAKGLYPFPLTDNVVPASDGAGVVEAVGPQATRCKTMGTATGGSVDGALREYGIYSEEGLVHMPANLTFLEASALPCAAVTAWNALYGIEGRSLKPGDWVLTQGTAKAAGARVIATTSSAGKAERLQKLGADYVLNYVEDSEWGSTAKKLTGGSGVQHVIEVTGGPTMRHSVKAIAPEGVISIIGFRGGTKKNEAPSFAEVHASGAIVRGIAIGSRHQFEQMNRAIEANDIKPVVDQKVFKLKEAREAYQYMWDQKHFGDMCIEIEESKAPTSRM